VIIFEIDFFSSKQKPKILENNERFRKKTGSVKWFNPSKGYGFIEHEEGKEIFVHYSAIAMEGYKELKQGQIVEFEIETGPKGAQATAVIPVS